MLVFTNTIKWRFREDIIVKRKRFPTGGARLPEEKSLTSGVPIKQMPPPEIVVIPLKQHVGAECTPIVEPGQMVVCGELIGTSEEKVSANVHASISGRVRELVSRKFSDGSEILCVVIERKHVEDTGNEESFDKRDSREYISLAAQKAGIVGLGGACFPTHLKLRPPEDKKIDTVIVNGAECEPYITVDHRLMLEYPEKIFRGLELARIAINASNGLVACEVNKPDALDVLMEEAANWENLDVVPLDTMYPHGAEKHLIKAVLGREVPLRGLQFDIGVLVNNVQTIIALTNAVDYGKALTQRVITVSGRALASQANLIVPLGTSVRDVIDYCGGIINDNYRVVLGGPMTGIEAKDLDIPVTKGTSGIVVLTEEEYLESDIRPCIRCGKCVDCCPMYLSPNRIVAFVNNQMYDEAKESGVIDCIECGACAYVCPSKRPLLKWLRRGKAINK